MDHGVLAWIKLTYSGVHFFDLHSDAAEILDHITRGNLNSSLCN